ncbi:MAG: GNAT family N-acetyltransferase [Oscillospiraceae bacterium]|nr:GNAT family N-acetyltransferase [Oscillospiraceae bacterium]
MSAFEIREYKIFDVPAMRRLWHEVFGDPEELTEIFYLMLPDMGSAVVAVEDKKIIGMANVINGMELIERGVQYIEHEKEPPVCGYIYAVAVDPEHRGKGIGRELCLEAEKLARKRESDIVCTLPASESLYKWYRDIMGFEPVLRRKSFEVKCEARDLCMELSSTEYMMWRESMLRNKSHLHPSHITLEWEKQFCKVFGGGLYACSSGICAAMKDGDTCVIKEIISAFPGDEAVIAASVGKQLGCEKAVYYLPSSDGMDYLAALSGSIPADAVWNFTFD